MTPGWKFMGRLSALLLAVLALILLILEYIHPDLPIVFANLQIPFINVSIDLNTSTILSFNSYWLLKWFVWVWALLFFVAWVFPGPRINWIPKLWISLAWLAPLAIVFFSWSEVQQNVVMQFLSYFVGLLVTPRAVTIHNGIVLDSGKVFFYCFIVGLWSFVARQALQSKEELLKTAGRWIIYTGAMVIYPYCFKWVFFPYAEWGSGVFWANLILSGIGWGIVTWLWGETVLKFLPPFLMTLILAATLHYSGIHSPSPRVQYWHVPPYPISSILFTRIYNFFAPIWQLTYHVWVDWLSKPINWPAYIAVFFGLYYAKKAKVGGIYWVVILLLSGVVGGTLYYYYVYFPGLGPNPWNAGLWILYAWVAIVLRFIYFLFIGRNVK